MKKSFVLTGLLTGIMALGAVVVSCSANVENGAKNELAGKSFSAGSDSGSYSLEFTDDTFIITANEEPWDPLEYCGDYRIREEYTYSCTVNSEMGYFLSKPMNETVSYVRDGTTLYTEPDVIPETLEAYKAERTKLFKALNPSITEAQVTELLNEDSACESVEKFNEWRKWNVLREQAEKKFYYTYAYKLEGNEFVLSDEDWTFIPQGLKFGDIFNGSYEFGYSSSNSSESDYPDFEINVYTRTMTKEQPNISIRENDIESDYTILSATNDSMTITKVTGWKHGSFWWGYIEFDEAKAFTCPITYTNGEDKVTATITIEGKEYSFDIEYVTNELISRMLEEGDTFTLQ